MNYLAHLFLSGDDRDIKIGNFIADSVKGKSYSNFPAEVQNGILLHREIDYFTDNHDVVKLSKNKFRNVYGKHSGIIIDILYDHFLSINWLKYSDEDKSDFIKNSYSLLLRNFYLLPGKVKLYLPFMVVNNWLAKYELIDGIEQVFRGMSMRTSLPDETGNAMIIFNQYYDDLGKEFELFFPDLVSFVNDKLSV